MHIRNDPHIPDSEGLHWIHRGRNYRNDVLARHVEGERLGYRYMFPVFFPLDEERRSYDVIQDGNMIERMDGLMR
jgi:hypothetical protein